MTRYLVIIEGEGSSFSAYSPDLLGCVAAGDTREETLHLMQEAITFHLEGLKEDGEVVPPAVSVAEYVTV